MQQLARRGSILRGFGRLCWDAPTTSHPFSGARMPRQVDYYFSFQSPWAYIGHKPFQRSRKYLRSQGESQAGGAGRSVLGDRRIAADEAPSGAAALPDGRTAALARQARPEIPSAAGELAVQCAAGRWRRDRGDRGRPRSRSISAAGLCRASWEDQLNLGRSRDDCKTGRRIRAARQAIGGAIGIGRDQRGL